jgi:putative ABC transport system permease protein
MKLKPILKIALTETRRSRGRLTFCISSIAVGVFAICSIRTSLLSLEENIHDQAKSLMGADLLIHSDTPFGDAATRLFNEIESLSSRVRSSGLTEFYSMIYGSEREPSDSHKREIEATRLVRVRAISGDFPLHGGIETEPRGMWSELTSGKRPVIIADPDVIDYMNLKPGAKIMLGGKEFRLLASFIKKPGSPVSGFGFAPAVYIHARYLGETGLIQTGSRIRYSRYFLLPANFAIEEWKKRRWDFAVQNNLTIQTYRESAESVQRFLMRLSNFLTSIGLITLLMGGLGIGAAMRVFIRDRLDHAAVLRSLGATPRDIFLIYFSLAAALGLIGSLIGIVPGTLLPIYLSDYTAAGLTGNLLPVRIDIHFSPYAVIESLFTGTAATLLFTLFPLYRIRNVSPLRVLRRIEETEGLPGGGPRKGFLRSLFYPEGTTAREAIVYAVGIAAIFLFILGISVTQTGSILSALFFTGSIAGSLVAIGLISRLIVVAARGSLPWIRNFHLRQGIANLQRPGNQTGAVLTASGIGTLLISTILILEASIQSEIRLESRPEIPNLFIVDVQRNQRDSLEAFMDQSGVTVKTIAPMVSARIQAINGRPVEKKILEQDASKRTWEESLRTREYFLTYRDHLLDSEELTRGRFWSGRPADQELSVEQGWADSINVRIGDTITLDIQGIPLHARVTSFRKIRWQAMRPNAILLLSPGWIESAPRMYVASLRHPEGIPSAAFQKEIVRRYPNVSVIDVKEAADNILLILDRISIAVRFLSGIALFNGILILTGAVASGRYARLRESMLFKVLGADRMDLIKILISEYAVLALIGCMTGWILSEAINRPILIQFFETEPTVPYALLFSLLAGIVMMNTLMGILTGRDVDSARPMDILREE